MSLPSGYTDANKYFEDAISFLAKYSWLHRYPNVEITTRDLLACYPPEWPEYFRKVGFQIIKEIGMGKIDPNAPESLKAFMRKVLSMTPVYDLMEKKLDLTKVTKFGQKKLHEVSYLAPMVDYLCIPKNIKYIIDIGSGCGYLSHVLCEIYGYKVLGLECSDSVLKSARKVQNDHYPGTKKSVVFMQCRVTADCGEDIMEMLRKSFQEYNGEDVFFVALHACADLSVHFMDLFRSIKECKGGIVMPCCYHLLKTCKLGYVNFPLSQEFLKYQRNGLLDTPFFRLATQQTSSRWGGLTNSEQILQAQNLLFRNILQEAIDEEDIACRRQIRKTGFGDDKEHYSIESYAERLDRYFEFVKQNSAVARKDVDAIKDRVISLYYEKGQHPELLIEAFISLQIFIQAFCENLILLDRVCYINGYKDVQCVTHKITNDQLSARCFGLVLNRIEDPVEDQLRKMFISQKDKINEDDFVYNRKTRSVFK